MRRLLLVSSFLSLSLCTPGCFSLDFDGDGDLDSPPPGGYEVDYLSCSDGRDNDLDGRIDCQDTDCLMRGHCGEMVPVAPNIEPEITFDLCRDGVDNDDDGQFDCGDRDCQAIFELCCLSEIDDATCSDRIDNDGNGFADCSDFSCRNNPFVSVCESESSCTDRIDNDGDRFIDCADSECECTDDCNPGCAGPEDTLVRCGDGFDNDGNGFTDCGDFSCSMSTNPDVLALCAAGGVEETTVALCSDGLDNEDDGFTDCADFSCNDATRGATPEAVAFCAMTAENTLERCSDMIDNDENGFTDCQDFSCSRATDPTVAEMCRLVGESNVANCSDGIDNDMNGFRDCADFSCQFVSVALTGRCATAEPFCPPGQACYRGDCISITSPCSEGSWFDVDSTVQGTLPVVQESTFAEQVAMAVAQCTDGVDNDDDGFIDCEDWECNYNPRVIGSDGNPICRHARGRTCTAGLRAGQSCVLDEECAGAENACGLPAPEGTPFVCR